MISASRLTCLIYLAASALLLAGCTTPPGGDAAATAKPTTTPTAAPAPAPAAASTTAPAAATIEPVDDPPVERPEAYAQCWMKYDRSGASLEAKAKLVDKCAADKMMGN